MMETVAYSVEHAAEWDDLVGQSPHGTVLHSRRFLDYHGERFRDVSVVFREKSKLIGVLPAAFAPSDSSTVVSHPGATYGGVVARPASSHPAHVDEMLDGAASLWRQLGARRVLIRPPPVHLVESPNDSVTHALWRRGATIVRSDLWNAIPLDAPRSLSKGHTWSLGKARKAHLELHPLANDDEYDEFHAFLAACLADRHQVAPVHSAAELIDLRGRLGESAALYGVRAPGERDLVAASWVFRYGSRAWHTQYLASSLAGRDSGAMVFLVHRLLEAAADAGVTWFSFGASSEDAGRQINHGLFAHKAAFGSGAIRHDTWEWCFDGVVSS